MHLIRKISIDAVSSCEKTGRQLNDEINSLIADELNPKLSTLLDKYKADAVVTAIDSISISLPPLTTKNWKKEFVTGCLNEIEAFLDKYYIDKEIHTAAYKASVTTPESYMWKAVFDFLQTGIIENSVILKKMQEANLFESITAQTSDTLKSLLAHDKNALVRLVLTAPVNFKNTILANTIPDYKFKTATEAALKTSKISFNSESRLSAWVAIYLAELHFFRKGISSDNNRLKKITDSYFSETAPEFPEIVRTLIADNKLITGNDSVVLKFLELQSAVSQNKEIVSESANIIKVKKAGEDTTLKPYDTVVTNNDAAKSNESSKTQDAVNTANSLKSEAKDEQKKISFDKSETIDDERSTLIKTITKAGDNNFYDVINEKGYQPINEAESVKNSIAEKKQPDLLPPATLQESNLPDVIYIKNGGLVLLFPFLNYLFQNSGLTQDNKWVSVLHQQKAALITQYAVTGNTNFNENELLLNKLLCGYAIHDVVDTSIEITESDKTHCREMLQSVIHYWEALKNSSPEALQETFLQREAKVSLNHEVIEMWVESKAFDILLQKLPWSIAMVKTPWMEKLIQCNWY
jgi:hypothetical protein